MSKVDLNAHDVDATKLDVHVLSYKDGSSWISLEFGDEENKAGITLYSPYRDNRRESTRQALRNLAVAAACAMAEFEEQIGKDEINVRITNKDFAE